MQMLVRILPATIQIATSEGAPIVAINDTVWIKHWNYFEYESFPQHFGFFVLWIRQELKDTSHHPGSYSLTRVDPRRNDHCLFLLRLLDISFLRDCKKVTILPRERFTKSLSLADLSPRRIQFDLDQVLLQIAVGVREAVSEVNCVVFMLELITERQGVVAEARIANIFLDAVAVVGDALTATVPPSAVSSFLVRALGHFVRVNGYFHSEIEE